MTCVAEFYCKTMGKDCGYYNGTNLQYFSVVHFWKVAEKFDNILHILGYKFAPLWSIDLSAKEDIIIVSKFVVHSKLSMPAENQ